MKIARYTHMYTQYSEITSLISRDENDTKTKFISVMVSRLLLFFSLLQQKDKKNPNGTRIRLWISQHRLSSVHFIFANDRNIVFLHSDNTVDPLIPFNATILNANQSGKHDNNDDDESYAIFCSFCILTYLCTDDICI